MTTFDNRERGYENKFAHDQETDFNINARKNKLLGLWAAGKMHLSTEDAKNYATALVEKTAQKDSVINVIQQLQDDFAARDISISQEELAKEAELLLLEAKEQITNIG